VFHSVKRRESISSIASIYGVTKEELADANNLSTKSKLKTGMRLRIPFTNVSAKSDFAYNSNIEEANDNGSYVSPYENLNKNPNNPETNNSGTENIVSNEEEISDSENEPTENKPLPVINPVGKVSVGYTV
jgi:murein DD-endopeptidase MepM/ murein hydrolase activator NlpD